MLQPMSIANDIAAHLLTLNHGGLKVAIDGVDGVGKTTFADELADILSARRVDVIRASADGYHNRRAIRHRLGKSSPEGFYRDSYNYPALGEHLLDPLSDGGSRRYRIAIFDHFADASVVGDGRIAPERAILIFDGLFLHRPELRAYWDFSVFLDAPFEVTVPRGASRGVGYGEADPNAPSNRRYVEDNMLYFREAQPREHPP